MYLGIDLGTSNSAVAGVQSGRARLFKTPEGTDTMPSVIYRDRRGNQTVGLRAFDPATHRQSSGQSIVLTESQTLADVVLTLPVAAAK